MKLLSILVLIVAIFSSDGSCLSEAVSSKIDTELDKITIQLPTKAEMEKIAQNEIFLQLSPQAEIYLRDLTSYTGRLMATNSQEIKIEADKVEVDRKQQISEDITNIDRVVFNYKNITLLGNNLVIRGEPKDNSTERNVDEWTVSLNAFNIINPIEGQAKLNLSDLGTEDRKEIIAIARDSFYIVEQIKFDYNSPEKIKVKVHPQ